MGFIPPLSLGPPVVRPFKTTVVRPGGNFTRMFLAHTVPATKSIPASTKSETRFIDCPFRSELTNSKTDTLWKSRMSSKRSEPPAVAGGPSMFPRATRSALALAIKFHAFSVKERPPSRSGYCPDHTVTSSPALSSSSPRNCNS